MDKEIPKTPLLGTGKGQDRLGIKFLGGQHGGQGIKIGIDVGGDDVHNIKLSIGNGQLAIFNGQFKFEDN
jgi:hypothetical protein